MLKYYIYLHKRLDNNEIFYVGRAKIYTGKTALKYPNSNIPYRRAYDKNNRNKEWYQVIGQVDYCVIILFKGINLKKACELESNLIGFHGRLDLNTGTLTNKTDGGETESNRIRATVKIRSYDNDGNLLKIFNSAKEAASYYNLGVDCITNQCKYRRKGARKGIRFRYDSENLESISKYYIIMTSKSDKGIGQYDLNMNLIQTFCSVTEASQKTGCISTTIYKCCNGIRKKHHGYIWQYMEKK